MEVFTDAAYQNLADIRAGTVALAREGTAELIDLFIASFAEAPDVGTHVLLGSGHLGDYSADVLARLPDLDAGIVSLTNARQFRVAAEEAVTESAEQWIDLLERTQMSHGFLARRASPRPRELPERRCDAQKLLTTLVPNPVSFRNCTMPRSPMALPKTMTQITTRDSHFALEASV